MKDRRIVSLLLAGAVALGLSIPALADGSEGPGPGDGVPAAEPWYAQAQSYVMERNIMTGMADSFDPGEIVTRAMMVQALWNMEGRPLQTDVAQFADVAVTAWYQDSAAWAQNMGIVWGDGLGNYNAQGIITRGEMALLLYRYAQCKGLDVSSGEDSEATAGYGDAQSVPGYAAGALGWAVKAGVMNGRVVEDVPCLDHAGTATRAELATVLMRMDRLANGEVLLQTEEEPQDEEGILLPPEVGEETAPDGEELPGGDPQAGA